MAGVTSAAAVVIGMTVHAHVVFMAIRTPARGKSRDIGPIGGIGTAQNELIGRPVRSLRGGGNIVRRGSIVTIRAHHGLGPHVDVPRRFQRRRRERLGRDGVDIIIQAGGDGVAGFIHRTEFLGNIRHHRIGRATIGRVSRRRCRRQPGIS